MRWNETDFSRSLFKGLDDWVDRRTEVKAAVTENCGFQEGWPEEWCCQCQKQAWWWRVEGVGGYGRGGLGCFSFFRSFIQQILSLYPVTNTASCWEYKVEQDSLPSCPHGVRFCPTWIGITGHSGTATLRKVEIREWSSSGRTCQGECQSPDRGPGGGQGSLVPLKAQLQSTPLPDNNKGSGQQAHTRVTTSLNLPVRSKGRQLSLKTIKENKSFETQWTNDHNIVVSELKTAGGTVQKEVGRGALVKWG